MTSKGGICTNTESAYPQKYPDFIKQCAHTSYTDFPLQITIHSKCGAPACGSYHAHICLWTFREPPLISIDSRLKICWKQRERLRSAISPSVRWKFLLGRWSRDEGCIIWWTQCRGHQCQKGSRVAECGRQCKWCCLRRLECGQT